MYIQITSTTVLYKCNSISIKIKYSMTIQRESDKHKDLEYVSHKLLCSM